MMKKNILLSLCLSLCLFPLQAQIETPVPFGVNLSGAEFGGVYPGIEGTHYGYPTYRDLDYFKSKGLTLIRFPFRWERVQPVLDGPLDAGALQKMKDFVADAEERGMQVILDVHNFARYSFDGGTTEELIGVSSRLTKEHLANLWVRLATEFKGFTNIWGYDIMNEPYAMSAQMPWFNIAQTVIDAIRTVDTETPIIVSGDSFSSALNWVYYSDNLRNLVDPSDNLVYQAHLYFDKDCSGAYKGGYDAEEATPMTGVERARPFVEWLKRYGKRGLIGEYGVPDNDGRWLEALDNLLSYMRTNGVAGTYWSAGPRWGSYALSVQPTDNYLTDRPQMRVLAPYAACAFDAEKTLKVADFEANDGGTTALSGGKVAWRDNPVRDASGNASQKVLAVEGTDFVETAFPVAFPAGEGWTDYDAVRFKLHVPSATAGADRLGFSVGVSDGNEVRWADPSVENAAVWVRDVEGWQEVVLRFHKTLLQEAEDALGAAAGRWLVIKWELPACTGMVDDVELMVSLPDGASGGETAVLLYDFEEDALGVSPRYSMPWQGSAEVAANTVPTSYNPSLQCLKVVNPECSPVLFSDALPAQASWDDYEALQFDICFLEGNDIGWASVEMGVRMGDGTHVKLGAVYDSSGNEAPAWHGCSLNTWMPVTLAFHEAALDGEVSGNPQLYVRVWKNNNVYLLDNVRLVPKRQPSAVDEGCWAPMPVDAVRVYGMAQGVVVACGRKMRLPLCAVSGAMVRWLECQPGVNRFEVEPGFYIVGSSKVVVR